MMQRWRVQASLLLPSNRRRSVQDWQLQLTSALLLIQVVEGNLSRDDLYQSWLHARRDGELITEKACRGVLDQYEVLRTDVGLSVRRYAYLQMNRAMYALGHVVS